MNLDHVHPVAGGAEKALRALHRRSMVLDRQHFDEFLRLGLDLGEMAVVVGSSEEAIQQFCLEHYGVDYGAARAEALTRLRVLLSRKAVTLALEGNAGMLEACLQNLCGWDGGERTRVPRSPSVARKGGRRAVPGPGQDLLPGLVC